MIQFNWPWIFLLLPVPLLLQRPGSRVTLASISIPPGLESALQSLSSHRKYGPDPGQLLTWLCWISLLLALSQPWRTGDAVIQPVSGRAIALAVDVSGSMERKDFSFNAQEQDRLSVVKEVAHDFVMQRRGDRISLVLYGKDAFIASPLTFDLAALGSILDSAGIGMAGRSTAIGDAIGLAIQSLRDDPATSKAIVLLSDGTNNSGSVEPESAASLAQSLGIRIHTIAMGSIDRELDGYNTAQSADLDVDTLKAVASTADGEFFRATNTDDLKNIYNEIDKLESAEVEAPPVIVRQDLRQWPQAILLICLLALAIVHRRLA